MLTERDLIATLHLRTFPPSSDSASLLNEVPAQVPTDRKAKRKAADKARKKQNATWMGSKSKRTCRRRADKSVHIATTRSVEDFAISKGGRCGRRTLEAAIKALESQDRQQVRELLQEFTAVSQPKCVQ